jgi:hypothetical protein
MIRSLWIAKTGLDAQQTQLDVITNNLANVSTNGFKRARAVFEDLLYQTMRQPGAQSSQQTQIPSGLQIGTGVRPSPPSASTPRAILQQTGNARHRHPGRRLLPDPDARRHPGLHARRRLPEGQPGRDGHLQRLSGVSRHHHSANAVRSPSAATASSAVLQAGQATPTQVGTSSWRPSSIPAACRAWARTCSSKRPPAARRRRTPGHQRRRPAQPGLCRDVERQRRRGTGEHDPDAARLRNQLARHPDLGPDAGAADAAVRKRRRHAQRIHDKSPGFSSAAAAAWPAASPPRRRRRCTSR